MLLLTQFLLRLAFGLCLGMLAVSARQVTSGYFRNNLYVALGLAALASLLTKAAAPDAFWFAALAAGAAYVGAVGWLYERPAIGKAALLAVAVLAIAGAFRAGVPQTGTTLPAPPAAGYLRHAAVVASGLLLGLTMAAMLLGHWYLNSPTMEIRPLQRLILAMAAATVLQTIVAAGGLAGEMSLVDHHPPAWLLFVLLRWLFGLVGVGAMAWMAWQTLKIPNTQSATGILYVAVIGTFVGETMSMLLSVESVFPV